MDYAKKLIWLAVVGGLVIYGTKLVTKAASKSGVG